MKNLVFFLEGYSEKVMLEGLLSRLLPENVSPVYCVFKGKKDLEKNLFKKIQGWQKPESAFIVLLDQDQENCKSLKKRILEICKQCENSVTPLKYIIRVACRELESWYFGDLEAVGKAFNKPKLPDRYKNKKQYKNPDKIQNPAKELEKITNKEYQKISGSRAIGSLLSWENNKSRSFKVFIEGIKDLVQ